MGFNDYLSTFVKAVNSTKSCKNMLFSLPSLAKVFILVACGNVKPEYAKIKIFVLTKTKYYIIVKQNLN